MYFWLSYYGKEASLEYKDLLEDEFNDYGNPFKQPPPAAAGLNTRIITNVPAKDQVIMGVLRPAAAGGGCWKGLP